MAVANAWARDVAGATVFFIRRSSAALRTVGSAWPATHSLRYQTRLRARMRAGMVPWFGAYCSEMGMGSFGKKGCGILSAFMGGQLVVVLCVPDEGFRAR